MPVPVAFAALPAGILFALITLRTRSIYWALLLHFVVRFASDLFTALAT
jgi:membrane protease YdiL (CAAX protease family)